MNVRGSLISSKSARIGAFIAEMDYGLAPCVAEAIEEATERGALGYIPDPWKKEVARSCAASCFASTSFRYESSICCRVILLTLLSKANINSPMNLWVS